MYFVKRHTDQVKKENFHTLIMFGDMSHLALDHFTSLIDTVSINDSVILYIIIYKKFFVLAHRAISSKQQQSLEVAKRGLQ